MRWILMRDGSLESLRRELSFGVSLVTKIVLVFHLMNILCELFDFFEHFENSGVGALLSLAMV